MEMKDILKQHAESIDLTLGGFGEKLQKSIDAMGALDLRLKDIEQKGARGSLAGGGVEYKSLGSAFSEAEGLEAFASERERPGRFKVETKAILTSDVASAGPAAPNPYLDAVVALPKRPLMVRNLLPVIPVSTGSIEVPTMTARNNNAAMTAEAGQKPQSDFSLTMKTVTVRKIAHFIKASTEILADAPQLRGLIDTELLYGLALVEDTQLLLGDGTGVNLYGLMPQATAYSAATAGIAEPGGVNRMDRIGIALLQCTVANYSPDGIVMHPADWLAIRLTKDGQGRYIFGDPQTEVEPRLFGLPVIPTLAMTAGTFLVGQFAQAATLYDRMLATILASTEDGNNFTLNLVTILAEERLALAVKRGTALIKGNFTGVN